MEAPPFKKASVVTDGEVTISTDDVGRLLS
jgi:hypothetical protein